MKVAGLVAGGDMRKDLEGGPNAASIDEIKSIVKNLVEWFITENRGYNGMNRTLNDGRNNPRWDAINQAGSWSADDKKDFEVKVYRYIQDRAKMTFMKYEDKVTSEIDWYVFYDAGIGPWQSFSWYVPVRNPFTAFDPATTSQTLSTTAVDAGIVAADAFKKANSSADNQQVQDAKRQGEADAWTSRCMGEENFPEKFVHFPPENVAITFRKGVFENYHGVKRFTRLKVETLNVDKKKDDDYSFSDCNDLYQIEIDAVAQDDEINEFETAATTAFPDGFALLGSSDGAVWNEDTKTITIKSNPVYAKHITRRIGANLENDSLFPIEDPRSWGKASSHVGMSVGDLGDDNECMRITGKNQKLWWDIESPAEFLSMGIADIHHSIKNMEVWAQGASPGVINLYKELLVFGKRMGDANQPLIAAVFRVFLDLGLIKHGRAEEYGEFIESLADIKNIYVGNIRDFSDDDREFLVELCDFGEKLFILVTNGGGDPIQITGHTPHRDPSQVPPDGIPRWKDIIPEQRVSGATHDFGVGYLYIHAVHDPCVVAQQYMWKKWIIESTEGNNARAMILDNEAIQGEIDKEKARARALACCLGLARKPAARKLMKVKLFFNSISQDVLDEMQDREKIKIEINELTSFKENVKDLLKELAKLDEYDHNALHKSLPEDIDTNASFGMFTDWREIRKDGKKGWFSEWIPIIEHFLQQYIEILKRLINPVDVHGEKQYPLHEFHKKGDLNGSNFESRKNSIKELLNECNKIRNNDLFKTKNVIKEKHKVSIYNKKKSYTACLITAIRPAIRRSSRVASITPALNSQFWTTNLNIKIEGPGKWFESSIIDYPISNPGTTLKEWKNVTLTTVAGEDPTLYTYVSSDIVTNIKDLLEYINSAGAGAGAGGGDMSDDEAEEEAPVTPTNMQTDPLLRRDTQDGVADGLGVFSQSIDAFSQPFFVTDKEDEQASNVASSSSVSQKSREERINEQRIFELSNLLLSLGIEPKYFNYFDLESHGKMIEKCISEVIDAFINGEETKNIGKKPVLDAEFYDSNDGDIVDAGSRLIPDELSKNRDSLFIFLLSQFMEIDKVADRIDDLEIGLLEKISFDLQPQGDDLKSSKNLTIFSEMIASRNWETDLSPYSSTKVLEYLTKDTEVVSQGFLKPIIDIEDQFEVLGEEVFILYVLKEIRKTFIETNPRPQSLLSIIEIAVTLAQIRFLRKKEAILKRFSDFKEKVSLDETIDIRAHLDILEHKIDPPFQNDLNVLLNNLGVINPINEDEEMEATDVDDMGGGAAKQAVKSAYNNRTAQERAEDTWGDDGRGNTRFPMQLFYARQNAAEKKTNLGKKRASDSLSELPSAQPADLEEKDGMFNFEINLFNSENNTYNLVELDEQYTKLTKSLDNTGEALNEWQPEWMLGPKVEGKHDVHFKKKLKLPPINMKKKIGMEFGMEEEDEEEDEELMGTFGVTTYRDREPGWEKQVQKLQLPPLNNRPTPKLRAQGQPDLFAYNLRERGGPGQKGAPLLGSVVRPPHPPDTSDIPQSDLNFKMYSTPGGGSKKKKTRRRKKKKKTKRRRSKNNTKTRSNRRKKRSKGKKRRNNRRT